MCEKIVGLMESAAKNVHFDSLGICTTNVDGGAQPHALQRITTSAEQMRVTHACESGAHVKADAGDHIVVPLNENGIGDAGG